MIDIKPIHVNSPNNKLEYYNALGLIFQNHVCLNRDNDLLQYEINDIKRIYFKKNRCLKNNYSLFMISLVMVVSTYLLRTYFINYIFFSFIIATCIMLFSLFKNYYSYSIMLITIDHNIISVPINETSKEKASKLVALIKRKIKNNNQYLKAS
ncbi:hypothetical protein [Flavobacterium sp.]|uniref:hypothetical protein n=1 Tax=Flavobacterium sp. TaxID=239 RepID=UPI002FD8A589